MPAKAMIDQRACDEVDFMTKTGARPRFAEHFFTIGREGRDTLHRAVLCFVRKAIRGET